MAHVVVLDSISQDIFICGHCKLVFNSMKLFLEHKNYHCSKEINNLQDPDTIRSSLINSTSYNSILQQPFPCNNNDVQTIITTDTLVNDIFCTICKKRFKRMKCLHAHLKSHERVSQCPVCGRCFENNSHLKRHVSTHKVWPDGLNETTPKSLEVELLSYSCSYCESVLSNYSQFRAHLNNHISLKKFKCIQGECNCFFETVEELLCHISAAHESPNYMCHICKKPFSSLKDIAIHRHNHNEYKKDPKANEIHQFKCSLCDATFRKPEKLSLHMLTENHSKACIHCNKIFASDKRLRMHLQIHKKSKPYQCTICNSSFHMKKYLMSHMLKHGETRFTCDVCKQSFKRQDVLQRHMKIHLLRKRFKCPFENITECKKEFTRRDKLKDHIRSHEKCMRSSSKHSKFLEKDAGTLEICIVPLDASDIVKI